MSDTKQVEKTIELDEATAKEIAKHVPAQEFNYDELAEKIAAKQEKAVEKEVADSSFAVHTKKSYKDMTVEEKTVEQFKALVRKDSRKLSEMNFENHKAQVARGLVSKTGIHQSAEDIDGGALVPDPDFIQAIVEAQKSYGDVSAITQSYNVNSDSVRTAALTSRPQFTKVGSEGGSKTSTKAQFKKDVVELDEYAGFSVITEQLLDDSAFDVYNVLVQAFAEELAGVEDQVIIDAITGNADVLNEDVANRAAFDLDKLGEAQYLVPVKSQMGGTTVFNRAALSQLRRERDSQGSGYLWGLGPNGGEPTDPWGHPYRMSEKLAVSADGTEAGEIHAIFGNYGRYAWLLRKNGLKISLHESGIVTTADSVEHNLLQENKVALRVVARRQAIVPLGDTFVVIRNQS